VMSRRSINKLSRNFADIEAKRACLIDFACAE
jgi:hypothetical protein